jgi:8-oxo-dGTP pyrophosphatase MutT (NUDIX family)
MSAILPLPEMLDVFDAAGAALDPPFLSIDDVHRRGLWHRTFACWLVSPRGTVLLQKRGPRNRIDPGSYDAAASGHLRAGETPDDGWRELHEELGIEVPAPDRFPIGIFRNQAVRGDYINNEFCHVFLARWQGRLQDLTLQAGEVAGCAEIPIAGGLALFGGQQSEAPIQTGAAGAGVLRRTDMCNAAARSGENGYYLKVMQAADDLHAGRALRWLPPL